MRQEQKVQGVPNLKIIITILLAGIILGNDKSFAQNIESEFQRDFLKKFHYPSILKNSCTATFTNLLIEIADDGSIQNIAVSDSAPQLFKEEFNRIRTTLNLDLIKSLIIKKNLKSSAIMIPIFYVYESDYCVNSFDNADYLEDNYYRFDGRELKPSVYNLKPIIGFMYKPMR